MIEKFLKYLELEKKYSLLTISSYKRDLTDLERFFIKTESSEKIETTTTKQLRNFIIYLSENNFSEKTINRKISSIRSFFKFLLKTGNLTINPAANLQNLKQKKRVLIPYTEEEIDLLETHINEIEKDTDEFERIRNHLIFEFFYQTGIRRIELIRLENTKINLPEKTLNIIGKRNKERLIPIGNNLQEKIESYLKIKNLTIKKPTIYFFTTKRGKILEEKFVYNLINKYLSTVTTKEKKSPHMLRHTFASHLLHNGAELNSIKEILGHSSLAATQVYTHSNIEDLKKVFNQSHPFGLKNKEK